MTLKGNVVNDKQLDAVVEKANSVTGVEDVDSDAVTINNKAQVSTTSDALITAKVKGAFVREKLFGDKTIDVTGISVTTQNGVVSLSGTADSQTQITNAISIAKKIKGVTYVKSTVTPKE